MKINKKAALGATKYILLYIVCMAGAGGLVALGLVYIPIPTLIIVAIGSLGFLWWHWYRDALAEERRRGAEELYEEIKRKNEMKRGEDD